MKKSEQELWKGGAKAFDGLFNLETLEHVKSFRFKESLASYYEKLSGQLKSFDFIRE